jgi:hypothetical protein
MFPESDTKFYLKGMDLSFTFLRDEKGQISALEFQANGRKGMAKRRQTNQADAKQVSLPEVREVLALARAGMGYENLKAHPSGFQVEGTWEGHGLKGHFTLQFTPRGKFLRRIESRVNDLVAFDGVTGWGVDFTGVPHVLEMDDLESAQTPLWVQTGYWLADDGPFTITFVPEETTECRLCLRLQLKSRVKDSRLLLDRATGLPLSLRRQGRGREETWEFQDYRKTDGIQLARRLVQISGPDKATFVIDKVRAAPPDDDRAYKPVLTRPDDTRFDRTAPVSVPIKSSATGHLYVHPRINGQDVGWFALDTGTGSGMTIAPAAADKLGMASFGEFVVVGAGKPQASVYRQGNTFELGPMSIGPLTYVQMPPALVETLSRGSSMTVAGTCGYSVFSRAVLVLDWKEEKLEIHDPNRFQRAAGEWQSLSLNQKIACVPCRFEDHEGLFRLDTGCPVILFHSPAVQRHKLLEGRQTQPVQVGGAGGTLEGRLGTLTSFTVSGHRFDKPRALFIAADEGALAEPYTTGTFGGQFLAPFQIVFDYPHRRIAFIEKSPTKSNE